MIVLLDSVVCVCDLPAKTVFGVLYFRSTALLQSDSHVIIVSLSPCVGPIVVAVRKRYV